MCVLLADYTVHPSYVPPRLPPSALAAAPGTRNTTISVAYAGFPAQARVAFQFAVDVWASQLNSPVPITIDARFLDLGPNTLGSAATGALWREVPGGIPGTYYPSSLANRLAGFDIDPTEADVITRFGSNVNWYFGTDGNAPAGTHDFVTVVLHELGHGLGFFGSGWLNASSQGTWGFGTPNALPGIYDRFVVNGFGQAFLDTALFPNPSFALGTQLTSGNLFFSGPQQRAVNGNSPARLYAPTIWGAFSSYLHLNEATYTVGNANSLMTPFLASAEAIHDPGLIVHGIFRDMGWSVNGSACTYNVTRSPGSFTASGGTGAVTITTGTGCGWTASSNAPWLTFTSPNTLGTGPVSLDFSVSANASSVGRSATISAGGATLTVTQAGVPCTFSLGGDLVTFGVHGGAKTLAVTASAQDCAFSIAGSAPWLTVSGAQTGSSTLTLQAGVSGAAARTTTVTVAGVPVSVRQLGDDSSTFDIDDDGAADVLAYDNLSGSRFFAVADPRNLGFVNGAISQWAAGWTVLTGDFNGDRRGDLFFYNQSTGRAVEGISIGTETFAYTEFAWSPGWQLTVLDLNGDRADDLFLYNPGSGRWFRGFSLLTGGFRFSEAGVWSPNWSIYPADFNGDGRGDLFLYNATGDANRGRWFRVLSGQDETFSYVEGDVVWSNNWTITPGDFDGDGRTDLFLYRASGDWYRVFFRAAGPRYESGVWSAGWTLSRGDFNADDRTDLFVYNPTSGRWYVVISEPDGTLGYYGGAVNWSPGWQVNVTDLDVDGRADLVLYNPADGRWFQAVTQSPGVFTFANGTWPAGLTILATQPQPK
ncbi:MAG TPA: FG-GAP-like repeat-containing protein [Vicinamibacterales bacterium]|nr:FG-GAP-like repeat-containing protein [Vicinamibacterales bacterium]